MIVLRRQNLCGAVGMMLLLSLAIAPAYAGCPLFDLTEVYSNSDDSLQFVEYFRSPNSRNEIGQKTQRITCNTNSFISGSDLQVYNATANKYFIIGMISCDLTLGIHVSDYTVPCNLFSTSGVIVQLHMDAVDAIDSLTFTGIQLPSNGGQSLSRYVKTGFNNSANYADETGIALFNNFRGNLNSDQFLIRQNNYLTNPPVTLTAIPEPGNWSVLAAVSL